MVSGSVSESHDALTLLSVGKVAKFILLISLDCFS